MAAGAFAPPRVWVSGMCAKGERLSEASCSASGEDAPLVPDELESGPSLAPGAKASTAGEQPASVIKWLALLLLVFQNSGTFILTRYTRQSDGPLYLTTVVVRVHVYVCTGPSTHTYAPLPRPLPPHARSVAVRAPAEGARPHT